LKNLVYS